MNVVRPVPALLLSLAGLVVWAGHFAVIYAATALACERDLAGRTLLGLPWLPAMVGIATVAALALFALVLRRSVQGLTAPLMEGGEAEPRFTLWLACSTSAMAGLTVMFQAAPALLLAGCG